MANKNKPNAGSFEEVTKPDGKLSEQRVNADEAYQRREYQKAIALYTRIISENGAGPEVLNNRGLSHFALEDFPAAIQDFAAAIELDPTFINAYNNRGLAYQKLGEFEKASEDFYRAEDLDPQYTLEGTHVMPKLVD